MMRPEQEKAREYLYRKGTLLAPQEIHERVRAAFVATEEFLDSVSGAGEWCVQEIIDHLVETHRPSVEELRFLLRGERPVGGPIPASLQSEAPLARPWPALVEDLKQLHAEVLGILAGIPDDFVSEARAPLVMVVNARNPNGSETPLEWIEDLNWKAYAVIFRLHEIDHLNQAKRALGAARPKA